MGKLLTAAVVCLALSAAAVRAQTAPASGQSLDLVLVLDNSGSMKRNDPQGLTRAVVSEFLKPDKLPKDTRVSLVVFGDSADLVMPLTPLGDAGTRDRITAGLGRLTFSAKFTDTASAVERGLYELRHQARPNAQKAVVLMTDGIIDTGDKGRDAEKYRWLTTDLADACAKANARIFGIAFTDRADFQLIQSLGEKTGGDYYRILTADEVSSAFTRIAEGVARPAAPVAAPAPAATVAARTTAAPSVAAASAPPAVITRTEPSWLLWLGPALGLGGIVAGFFALTVFWRGAGGRDEARPQTDDDLIPERERASLQDLNDPPALSEPQYELAYKTTKIGRMKAGPGVLRVNRPTVSAQHAEIRYKNGTFYLIDTESINKTRVDDGPALQPYTEYPLKGGRVISIADCRFEFVVAGADTEKTQAWIIDPAVGLTKPVAKKGQGGNYFQ